MMIFLYKIGQMNFPQVVFKTIKTKKIKIISFRMFTSDNSNNNNKSSFIDLRESKVPSNKFERAVSFAGLAAKIALSGFSQTFKNSFSGQNTSFASFSSHSIRFHYFFRKSQITAFLILNDFIVCSN